MGMRLYDSRWWVDRTVPEQARVTEEFHEAQNNCVDCGMFQDKLPAIYATNVIVPNPRACFKLTSLGEF